MSNPVAPPSHFTASGGTTASGLLAGKASELALPPLDLLGLGAVYLNRRRLLGDGSLREGDVLRVHPNPRRFPIAGDWQSRLVHEEADYVVVNKPSGLPIHPTCDNARENLIALVEAQLGRSLWVCHRLDIATQGLVVFAKSRRFCRQFNQWLLEGRRVTKRYRALLPKAVSLGEQVHYMAPGDRGPHPVSPMAREGWKLCRLEIQSMIPLGRWWEGEISLSTGRHNQIRAQLGALGSPILGDDLYGSEIPAPVGLGPGECIALQAFELGLPDGKTFHLPRPW